MMLSGETAKGSFPVEAVRTMHDICVLAESVICYSALFNELRQLTALPMDTPETIACAAASASHEADAGAILVLTTSGNSARLLSKYRPKAPIIVITRNPQTARQVHLYRGCFPFHYPKPSSAEVSKLLSVESSTYLSPAEIAPWQEDVDARMMWGMEQAIKYGLLKHGQPVIAIQGYKSGLGLTNTLRILKAP